MKKNLFLFTFLCFIAGMAHAQEFRRHKIAVFTPLYLDSAFDAAGNFKYEKTGAKFANAGLEFYYGVQLALDSLKSRDVPLEVFICDSRSRGGIAAQLQKPGMQDIEMIIGQTNAPETRMLADVAQNRKIPFISTTFPNDAGVFNNPYFVILNSTLQAHVEGIYKFLQKFHANDPIVMFRKNGVQEDLLKKYFTDYAASTTAAPLRISYVDLPASVNANTVAAHLDSTRRTVCIAGSLDESFGTKLTQTLASVNAQYPVRVIGMPTWENFNFSKTSDLEIIYTNPFFYNSNSELEQSLASKYTDLLSYRPSDLFFRGYEAMLHFGLLLQESGNDIASNLSVRRNTVFTPFDIQPVFKDRARMSLDYFENKHLYFIKIFGTVKNILY